MTGRLPARGIRTCRGEHVRVSRCLSAGCAGWQAWRVDVGAAEIAGGALSRLAGLRQHRRGGQRSPHKPLLVLLALGRLAASGSSELAWPEAESALAEVIAEFGPASRTGRAQSAAYPFTRLRSDGVRVLDPNVPMDLAGPLAVQAIATAAAAAQLPEFAAQLIHVIH